jgi:transcriptional regulator with XRE-family HTH domain
MIGTVLRDWRTINRLSQREAAEKIGITPSTMSRIEAGKMVDANTVIYLIAWLFKGKAWLFKGKDDG